MGRDENGEKLLSMIRLLVSDVQGAPFPRKDFEPELYSIWYEHVQRDAQECFEFVNENYPADKEGINKTIGKMFK